MKFFCEYCGNRIDAEKDQKCPNCGASYKQNEKFLKLEEERKHHQQVNNEYKNQIRNHVLGTIKISKTLMILPIFAFVIIFTIVVVGFLTIDNSEKLKDNNVNVDEMFDSVLGEDSKEQEKVTANFNEFAETKNYKVKVEKYESVEDIFHEADSGYELVKFYLVVENLTTKEIKREDVNCIVDGVAQTNDVYSGHSDLPFYISRELAVKGTATFIVPMNATSYDIRYGDYVTIHIEK